MTILFDHPEPALLVHGGMLIQIRQTKAALEALGCQVDYLRWWDETQRADILHYFGRMPPHLLRLAQAKGIKVVLGELFAVQGSRPEWQLWWQRQTIRLLRTFMPVKFTAAFRWEALRLADAHMALTSWEARLLNYLFETPKEKIHVVPNGVEDAFLQSRPATRGPWLVCTATITERKRVLQLAQAAVRAQTPLWIIGKSYSDSDAYAREFLKLVKAHPQLLRFEGPIADRIKLAQVYRESRGFVLLSSSESLSLSALEAAACECPLLLADLPWARTVFQKHASYCPATNSTQLTARVLRQFYEAAPRLPAPPKPLSWIEVAKQVKAVYETLLTPPLDVAR
ncbi:MAG: glycosyltransferase [Verrucomicrobiota bacterium]|jgi:glycosyltransferase involved in cell wall biosynthesis